VPVRPSAFMIALPMPRYGTCKRSVRGNANARSLWGTSYRAFVVARTELVYGPGLGEESHGADPGMRRAVFDYMDRYGVKDEIKRRQKK
jgi:hypothetical protein